MLLFSILLKSQIIIILPLVLLIVRTGIVNILTSYERGYFRLKLSPTSWYCSQWLLFFKKLFYQSNSEEAMNIGWVHIRGVLSSVSKITPVSYYWLYCFGSIKLLCLHFVSINTKIFFQALHILVIKGVDGNAHI